MQQYYDYFMPVNAFLGIWGDIVKDIDGLWWLLSVNVAIYCSGILPSRTDLKRSENVHLDVMSLLLVAELQNLILSKFINRMCCKFCWNRALSSYLVVSYMRVTLDLTMYPYILYGILDVVADNIYYRCHLSNVSCGGTDMDDWIICIWSWSMASSSSIMAMMRYLSVSEIRLTED